jgi:hypothetical protein
MRILPTVKTGLILLLGALALLSTGCISIKTLRASQRAPGVVTLGGSACISNYDEDRGETNCAPSTVVDEDGGFLREDGDEANVNRSGQLLVAFRVPNGLTAPASFPSDASETTMTQSASYSQSMTTRFPPPAGQRWVGYVSGFRTVNAFSNAGDRVPIGLQAEFGLPTQSDGSPFAGPVRWRMAVGFRQLSSPAQSDDPVVCTAFLTACADSPPNTPPGFPADRSRAVSDFGVLGGSAAIAAQGGTATVSFPVEYDDGGGLGAKTLSLTASTTLPGGSATPGAPTMLVQPNGTQTMNVNVAVPAAAALGDYKVTLTASNGNPATTRSNTGTLTVADQVSPSVRISTPPNGSTFTFGQAVAADYGCTDQTNASGVRSCDGPVANGARIDTGSLGPKLFTVNTSDNSGNTNAATNTYTVRPRAAPSISMPFSFARLIPKTALIFLQVKSIPKGSTLTAVCKGKGCPVRKRFRKVNAKKNVTLKRFFPKSYPAGTMIEARVTKTGSVTAIRRTIFRKAKRPLSAKLCLAPGERKPKKC